MIFNIGVFVSGVFVCVSCYGVGGNSVMNVNLKLVGQYVEYIEKQFKDFKVKIDCNQLVMFLYVGVLLDQDMKDIGVYLGK